LPVSAPDKQYSGAVSLAFCTALELEVQGITYSAGHGWFPAPIIVVSLEPDQFQHDPVPI
jgi:hypothetical protein